MLIGAGLIGLSAACSGSEGTNTGTGGSGTGAGSSLGGSGPGASGATSGGATSGGASQNGGATLGGSSTSGGSTSGGSSAGSTSAGTSAGGANSGGATVTGGTSSSSGGSAGTGTGTGGASGGASSAGATATGGKSSTGGAAGTGGSKSSTGGSSAGGASAGAGGSGGGATAHFSFFMTSLEGMRRLSKSQNGFGGDLRYGEADGLSGADKICRELAEYSMPGAGQKQWRAFLSVGSTAAGGAVNAIDRVGPGPWYDRLGRVVAMNKAALLNARPQGADPAIINDLPNEYGVPNKTPDPAAGPVDNHHTLTGSTATGTLYGATATCNNWTSTAATSGRPRIGFSFVAGNRTNWISGQDEGGCGAGVAIEENGGSDPSNPIVGSGGGYGAIYCFALTP